MDNFSEIKKLKIHKQGNIISLHKPLLIILTISKIIRGHRNIFKYEILEPQLLNLLSKSRLKNSHKLNPHYPFVYLACEKNSWECSVNKSTLKNPNAASRKEVLAAVGNFNKDFFRFTQNNAIEIINFLLKEYWPIAYHEDLINDLELSDCISNFSDADFNPVKRNREFVINILDAYERKCCICDQSIRLADSLIGIDVCHVRPLQHLGMDHISNVLHCANYTTGH